MFVNINTDQMTLKKITQVVHWTPSLGWKVYLQASRVATILFAFLVKYFFHKLAVLLKLKKSLC